MTIPFILSQINQQELLKVQVHALIIFGLTFTINIRSAIITHKIADHLPVIQSTKIINIKTALPYTRNFSKRNCTLFNEALSDIDPSDRLHHTSADNAMDSFMQQYSTLFNSHFPLKKS